MPREELDVRDHNNLLEGVAAREGDQDTKYGTFPEGAYGPEESRENPAGTMGTEAVPVGKLSPPRCLYLLHEWHNLSGGVTQVQSKELSPISC